MTRDEAVVRGIIAATNSPTARLLAARKMPDSTPLATGVWYSDYDRVFREARSRHIPMIGVWTNGDRCSFCRRFATELLEQSFISWMQGSGALFWLGSAMDSSAGDAVNGSGYLWASGGARLNIFPFVGTFSPFAGTVYGKGSDFGSGRGADYIVARFSSFVAKCNAAKAAQAPAAKAAQAPAAKAAQAPAAKAGRLSIRINPLWDAAHVARFKDAMARNGGHCLCRRDTSPDTLCMCREFMESGKPGLCGCGVFEKYYA